MTAANQTKRQAALQNIHQGGLHEARTGGKSLKQQDRLVEIATSRPNLTASQLSWLAVGGSVDEAGRCQPEDEFFRVQEFFNNKRRIVEMTAKPETIADHPRARLVYCKAANNPYTKSGGSGLAVISSRSKALPTASSQYSKIEQPAKAARPAATSALASSSVPDASSAPVSTPVPATPTPSPDCSAHIARLQDMLD